MIVRFNLIVDNEASLGGGIGVTCGRPIIENNTVWGNVANRGGALWIDRQYCSCCPGVETVRNNISGGSLDGEGIYCYIGSDPIKQGKSAHTSGSFESMRLRCVQLALEREGNV